MAVLNTLDPDSTKAALTGWFGERLAGASDVEITDLNIPPASGMSMTTALFSVSWKEDGKPQSLDLVARIAPTTAGIFRYPDLAHEVKLLRAVHEHTDVTVPQVRWLEEDPAVLGSPFMIMDRAVGRVPADDPPHTVEGWVVDLSPEERGVLFDNTLKELAKLHAVDPESMGLGRPDPAKSGIAGQLEEWERFYDWTAETNRSETIEAALKWVKEHQPKDRDLVLCWGDSRLGNVMFGDDGSVKAVLDWEMATIADPQLDLGWFVLFIRYYSEGIGVPPLEGVPTREEAVARYEELSGRTAHDIDFYERFAALRLAILLARIGHLMISGGALPADSAMPVNNPASQVLARMFGLPAPEGDSENFVGKR